MTKFFKMSRFSENVRIFEKIVLNVNVAKFSKNYKIFEKNLKFLENFKNY